MSERVRRASLLAPFQWLRRRWWLSAVMGLPCGVVFVGWLLTEPLSDDAPAVVRSSTGPVVSVPAAARRAVEEARLPLAWPDRALQGKVAKTLVLEALIAAAERLNRVGSYTATFRKQERIRGKLGDQQTLTMKVRHKPFAIYFKFLAPEAGKEVVYAEGHHGNKLIAHSPGVARFLVPRLAVPPDHPIALADARHPVTEAGLANLTTRLIAFRRMDLEDSDAETILDRVTDPAGRLRFRSVHTHTLRGPDRPFARVEVLYDPDTFFPVDIRNFDWPAAGESGELLLAERYSYDELDLEAGLTALDFDPANPAYAFHRY